MKILITDSDKRLVQHSLDKDTDELAKRNKEIIAEKFGRVRVSKSDSIYLSSEGRSYVELHTIASELNLSSYARKRDLIFKVGE